MTGASRRFGLSSSRETEKQKSASSSCEFCRWCERIFAKERKPTHFKWLLFCMLSQWKWNKNKTRRQLWPPAAWSYYPLLQIVGIWILQMKRETDRGLKNTHWLAGALLRCVFISRASEWTLITASVTKTSLKWNQHMAAHWSFSLVGMDGWYHYDTFS